MVCAALMVMMVGGASAYFTATDSAENIWTVGNIAIDLQEPEYDASDKGNIVPNQVLPKDPKVKNTVTNEAYVFMRVSIPADMVRVVSDNGVPMSRTWQELFEYNISDGWVEICNEEGLAYNNYIFAYAANGECTPLATNATTTVLFENGEITFKNIIEGQVEDNLYIPITAYGIQTENIKVEDNKNPEVIWDILMSELVN